MYKPRRFLGKLRCRLGLHDWSDWRPCVVGTLTTFNTLNKFRECAWCCKRECTRTLYGLLLDDVQSREGLNVEGQMVQAVAKSVLDEFVSSVEGELDVST